MKMKYEKPAMEKVNLRNNSNVADECWAFANKPEDEGNIYYYEFDNKEWGGKETWLSFRVASGQNCKNAKGLEYKILSFGDNTNVDEATAVFEKLLEAIEAPANGSSNFDYESAGFHKEKGFSW